MSRIQQLPDDVRTLLDKLLRQGTSQREILRRLEPLLEEEGERPISAASLNRYATRMEKVGRRMREAQEIAQVWVAKFGEQPTGEVGQHLIQILQTLAFELTLQADAEGGKEDGKPVLDVEMIGDLALAVQRLERAATVSTQRERGIRQEVAAQAEKEVVKRGGVSKDTAAAIRAALEGDRV